MADNFYGTLTGIPIDYLVATPLLAAARGNLALATVMEEFIMTLGFKDGKPGGDPILITFKLTRPYQDKDSGQMQSQTITVNTPLLGIVPIPALLVESVNVSFTTSITSSSSDTSQTSASATASYGFGAFKASGSVQAQANHTRSTNQSATYAFNVQAEQQAPTEGMSKMMDVFASCIEPLPSTGGSS